MSNRSQLHPEGSSEDGDGVRIQREAAEWLARHDGGLLPIANESFEAWLRRDPRHAACYAEMVETWAIMDRLPEVWPPVRAVRRINPNALGRASLWAAAAALIVLTLTALSHWSNARLRSTSGFTQTVSTAVGRWKKLALPDGSVVQLNTDSAIEVDYSAQLRRVRLARGEATFTVAQNPVRPFVVSVQQIAVRAVGTAFNVRLHPEAVEVLVTEGCVRVDDAGKGASLLDPGSLPREPLLLAGQRVLIPTGRLGRFNARIASSSVTPPEIARSLAWQHHRLQFASDPLSEIVAEFNRYNRVQLIVRDAVLAARRFGGNFQSDDPETLVRLLETRFGVKVERREGEIVLGLAR